MKIRLTERTLARKAPATGTIELWDQVMPGLALRIHAGGKRAYCVTTRLAGAGKDGKAKQIRRTIGTTASHSLAEARAAAREVVEKAAKGVDMASREAKPETARKSKIERERSKAGTFRAVVSGYLSDTGKHGGALMRSKTLVEQRIENHTMPRFGDWPIAEISRRDVRDLLREIAVDKPVAANRLLSNLKRVFKWAVEEDLIEASPISDLDKLADEVPRDRVLTDDEIVAVWNGCGELSAPHCGAIRLMLLTGARRREASGLKRSELRGGDWHLPAERSKNGKPHIWPLSDLARETIDATPQIDGGDAAFSFDGEIPVNGWSKVKKRLDRKIGEARAKEAGEDYEPASHDLPRWTFHDLRRTLVTGMVESPPHGLGVSPHVVEAVVNHLSGTAKAGVAGTYNRAVHLPARRTALEAWSSRVAALVAGEPLPDNVAVFRATGAA